MRKHERAWDASSACVETLEPRTLMAADTVLEWNEVAVEAFLELRVDGLVLLGIANMALAVAIPQYYGESHSLVLGNAAPVVQDVSKIALQGSVTPVAVAHCRTSISSMMHLTYRKRRGTFCSEMPVG